MAQKAEIDPSGDGDRLRTTITLVVAVAVVIVDTSSTGARSTRMPKWERNRPELWKTRANISAVASEEKQKAKKALPNFLDALAMQKYPLPSLIADRYC